MMLGLRKLVATGANAVQHTAAIDVDGIVRKTQLDRDIPGRLPIEDVAFKAVPGHRRGFFTNHLQRAKEYEPLLIQTNVEVTA